MSVPTVPPGVRAPGMQGAWFVRSYANLAAITKAELSAPTTTYLSCSLVVPVNPGTDQEREDTTRACLPNALEQLGRVKHTIENLRVIYDVQHPGSDSNKVYEALADGSHGALVLRWGLPREVPISDGQTYDAYEVSVGVKAKEAPEQGELTAAVFLTNSGDAVIDKRVGGVVPDAWAATTAKTLGQVITLTGALLEVTTAGTTGATAPTPPATVGATVTDGTVTWTRTA